MGETRSDKSTRRSGGVVRVELHTGAARPAHIQCHGHDHTYEVAWRETEDGPVVTDLRVTSAAGVPITMTSLRKIVPDRLARAAAEQGDDLVSLEAARDRMRARFAEKYGDELKAAGMDINDAIGEASAWYELRPTAVVGKRKRTRGQPKLTTPELRQVASWAVAAVEKSAVDGEAVHTKIAAMAAESGWRGYSEKHKPSGETVKGWIRRCKDAGVLASDYSRKPRRRPGGEES